MPTLPFQRDGKRAETKRDFAFFLARKIPCQKDQRLWLENNNAPRLIFELRDGCLWNNRQVGRTNCSLGRSYDSIH